MSTLKLFIYLYFENEILNNKIIKNLLYYNLLYDSVSMIIYFSEILNNFKNKKKVIN